MLRLFPGDGVKLPQAATPDQFGWVGLIDKLQGNVPFSRPVPANMTSASFRAGSRGARHRTPRPARQVSRLDYITSGP